MKFAVPLLTACLAWMASSSQAAPLNPSHVSNDAKWLIHIDFDAARESQIGADMRQHMLEHDRAKEALAKIESELGMNPDKDLHGATIYGTSLKPHTGVLIVYATGDKSKAMAHLKKKPGFKESKEGAYEIYSWTEHHGEHSQPVFLAIPHDGMGVVAGSAGELTAAMDVIGGKGGLDSGSPLLAHAPHGTIFRAAGIGLAAVKVPSHLPFANKIDQVNVAMGEHDGKAFSLVKVDTDNDAVAEQMKGMLDGFLAMGSARIAKDPDAKKLADGLKTKASGKTLMIYWTGSAADVIKMGAKVRAHLESRFRASGGKDWHSSHDGKKSPQAAAAADEKRHSSPSDKGSGDKAADSDKREHHHWQGPDGPRGWARSGPATGGPQAGGPQRGPQDGRPDGDRRGPPPAAMARGLGSMHDWRSGPSGPGSDMGRGPSFAQRGGWPGAQGGPGRFGPWMGQGMGQGGPGRFAWGMGRGQGGPFGRDGGPGGRGGFGNGGFGHFGGMNRFASFGGGQGHGCQGHCGGRHQHGHHRGASHGRGGHGHHHSRGGRGMNGGHRHHHHHGFAGRSQGGKHGRHRGRGHHGKGHYSGRHHHRHHRGSSRGRGGFGGWGGYGHGGWGGRGYGSWGRGGWGASGAASARRAGGWGRGDWAGWGQGGDGRGGWGGGQGWGGRGAGYERREDGGRDRHADRDGDRDGRKHGSSERNRHEDRDD